MTHSDWLALAEQHPPPREWIIDDEDLFTSEET